MNEDDIKKMQEEIEAKNAEIAKLQSEKSKNESNQNSYITKLENEVKGLKDTLEGISKTAANPQLDPSVVKYFKEQMVKDVKARAFAQITEKVGEETFKQLKQELEDFLTTTLNSDNTHEGYIVDAFNLIYGRAITNGTLSIITPQVEEAEEQADERTPAEILQSYKDTPPIITNTDSSASSDQPGSNPQTNQIRNTDEAIKSLKSKFMNLGNDRFN